MLLNSVWKTLVQTLKQVHTTKKHVFLANLVPVVVWVVVTVLCVFRYSVNKYSTNRQALKLLGG